MIFDRKTAEILRACDESCEILLKKLGGLVVRLLKTACYVGWAKLGVGTALEYGLQFWTTYCNALGQLVEPVTKHRRELLKASKRAGGVPQVYTNKSARVRLQELVKMKISIMTWLVCTVCAC